MKNIEFHDIPEEDYTYFVCIINSIILISIMQLNFHNVIYLIITNFLLIIFLYSKLVIKFIIIYCIYL